MYARWIERPAPKKRVDRMEIFFDSYQAEAEMIGATNKHRVFLRTFVEAEGTYFSDQS